MISRCCTPERPDYRGLSPEEKYVFCKMVYLLRKRGYSVLDAQAMACRKVLGESLPAFENKK